MAEKPKTKKVNLDRAFMYDGKTYGPGNGIAVPEDFRIPERKSTAGADAGSIRLNSSADTDAAMQTGGEGTSQGEDGGATEKEKGKMLRGMTPQELTTLAESKGVTVTGTGKNGEVTKDDFVKALTPVV